MKTLTLLLILCSISVFAQNRTTSSDYDEILLDGKTAYINVLTGDIVSERPRGVAKRITSQILVNKSQPISTSTSNNATHTVAKGETLYSISKKYNTSIAQLKALNPDISLDVLSINQEINVNGNVASQTPATVTTSNTNTNTYQVEKGDTLYAISRRFNISVSDLKSKNNLTSNLLSIGQVLIVN